MLIINTYLDKSKIHGVGVFADEFIKKETLISKIIPGLDCIVEKDSLKNLDHSIKKHFNDHAYNYDLDSSLLVLELGNTNYINHSDNSNIDNEGYASRDINIGEELTCNYKLFDSSCDYESV